MILIGFFSTAYAENAFFDNYEKSQIVLVGNVVSHFQRQNEIVYEIQVEDYFKNPQSAKVIAVFGPKSTQVDNPYQFDVGDRLFLYINQRDGVYKIQDSSFKLDYSCDAIGFIPPILTSEFIRGTPTGEFPRFSGADYFFGNIYKIGKPMKIKYTVYNYNPLIENATVTLNVNGKYQNAIIFSDQKKVTVPACNGSVPLEWSFTPQRADDYFVQVLVTSQYDTSKFVASFETPYVVSEFSARENISSKSIDTTVYPVIQSPLKQFKAGIPLDEIKCKEGFVFAQKASTGNPICVKPETKKILEQRGIIELQPPYSPYPDHN